MKHRSIVLIDQSAILHNLGVIQQNLTPGTRIFAVVKQDAYGHGAADTARLLRSQVDRFVVATVHEAIELRQAGITNGILVFEPPVKGFSALYRQYALTAVVSEFEHLTLLDRDIPFHIEFNTGMNRLGIPIDVVSSLMHVLETEKRIPEGIFTHFFASLEKDAPATREQYHRFRSVFHHFGPEVIRHAGNSEASFQFSDSHFDAIRPGVSLFGEGPFKGLRPAMNWLSYVSQSRLVSGGEGVSYGPSWKAVQNTWVATIPVGYADGYPRLASNKSMACVDGKWFPMAGTITMDYCFADTGNFHPKNGMPVWLLRPPFTAADAAASIGTISYEVMFAIGSRNKRRHVASLDYDICKFDVEQECLVIGEPVTGRNN
jgi:alanine racemase